MTDDRRLIEDFIPIKEISAESAREKSIRKGHISTLHLWWARRPLVASRAAVFASLVAAPENHQKRTAYKKQMIDLCQWKASEDTIAKARRSILEAQRTRLGLPETTPLSEVPPPKVLDMFAGGGAIPLEALRLGCETYAVDLNPVAHIIELCTLVYPQKYGKKLADEVEKWGNWVIEKVRAEIGDLYPNIKVGESLIQTNEQLGLDLPQQSSTPKQLGLSYQQELTPVAYLWTRTVKCPNPACRADVPLVRQTWLCKKAKKCVALKVIPNFQTMRVDFRVVEAATEKDLGFDPSSGSSRGNSTCRHCGTTFKNDHVKTEGKAGRIGQQLMAIVCTTAGEQGKTYLSATDYQHYIPDEKAILERLDNLCKETGLTIPDEPIFSGDTRAFFTHLYGLDNFGKLFAPRQLLSLMTFVKWVRNAHQVLLEQGYDEDFAKAISTYLGLNIGKVIDRSSVLCVWYTGGEKLQSPVSSGRLPMNWDFPENNPLESGSGGWKKGQEYLLPALSHFCEINNQNISLKRQSSTISMELESSSIDTVITDPPYFDAVPYADLSDYFYVWFKRGIGYLYPEHFSAKLTPKKQEATMEPSRHGGDKQKAAQAYEDMMHQAFCEANRVLKDGGLMCVVYAHKTTLGWSTLIDSLRRAKFTITEAWPLDTEQQGGLRSLRASLASSIFLISRKRTTSAIGDYSTDVQPQLKAIIQSRVKTLMEEGVSGADLVIACVGAGLRAYTQYDSVELPNGEELDATSFLGEVQKEVAETILQSVLNCDSKGVSQIDKATQYYILARYEYGEAIVEFDEANTLAKGVGVELDGPGGLTDGKLALVEKIKNTVKLRNYSDRGKQEELGVLQVEKVKEFNKKPQAMGQNPALIDILHRLLWLSEHKPADIGEYIALAQPDSGQLLLVAQALAGRALTGNLELSNGDKTEPTNSLRMKEQQAIDTLLASWKRTIEDNLFTQRK